MGRVVMAMSISLDGYFEGPGGDISWHRVDEEVHQYFNDSLTSMAAFLDGRVTWELMASYWPTADEDPSAPAPEREFARIWRDMPKTVVSTTLSEADWNTTIVRDVDRSLLATLSEAGDVAVGGAVLGAVVRKLDLVDEYRIYVHPVLLGAGRLMFEDGADALQALTLVETRAFGNGVVLLRYARDR